MWKFFILLVLASTVLAEKTPREKLRDAEEKCEREYHVTRKQIDDLGSEIIGDTDKIDRKYKCFIKCTMEEMNIKDQNGRVDIVKAAQVFNPTDEHAQDVVSNCAARHDSETDDCERLFKTMVCVGLNFKTAQDRQEEGN